MQNLPPLPLIDGCLFIDNSFLDLFVCPRKLQYNRLEQRTPTADNVALSFGTAIHLALEYRYKQTDACNWTDGKNEQAALLHSYFGQHPAPEDDHRDLNFAIEIIQRYNQRYTFEPFSLLTDQDGRPMVEMSFALPLFSWSSETPLDRESGTDGWHVPVIYTGRIDLPVMWDDQLIIMDHKTTGMLGSTFFDQYRMSAQQIGYCWAFEQATKKKVTGFAVNAIRTKAPTQKMLSGTASNTEIEKWWSEGFFREREYIQPWRIEEWKENTIALVREFLWHYKQDYMPMKTRNCTMFGRCPYYDVCYFPPNNRGTILESNQFVTNNWTPLKTQLKKVE